MFKLISTVFYLGCFPVASGTFSSIFFAIFCYFIRNMASVLMFLNLLIFTIGVYAVDKYTSKIKNFDPKEVVIDEFSGMLIATLLLKLISKNLNVYDISMLFIFFRIFDIFKPFPVSYFDNMHNPYGVMLDDIFAGIMAFASTLIVRQFL